MADFEKEIESWDTGKMNNDISLTEAEKRHNARRIMSKRLGCSTEMVRKTEVVMEKASEEMKDRLRRGDITIHGAYCVVMKNEKREAEAKLSEETRKLMALQKTFKAVCKGAEALSIKLSRLNERRPELDTGQFNFLSTKLVMLQKSVNTFLNYLWSTEEKRND